MTVEYTFLGGVQRSKIFVPFSSHLVQMKKENEEKERKFEEEKRRLEEEKRRNRNVLIESQEKFATV